MEKKTLHEIMQSVLKENGGSMHSNDLAEEIRRKGLYTQRDGTPLKDRQIHARVSNRPDLFVRLDGVVYIKDTYGQKAPTSKGILIIPKESEEQRLSSEAIEIDSIIQNVTGALGNPLDRQYYTIIDRGVPHTPRQKPENKMGVYCFCYNGNYLKIGKAGLKSNARFLSQHYSSNSAKSSFARSILNDQEMIDSVGVTSGNIKEWIKQNCRRIDIIIDGEVGIFTLELIEAVLHYRYKPRYEGFKTQR